MKRQVILPQTITQYFGLDKKQSELDFLDIYASRDIALFLDPYGISAMGTNWSRDCEIQIATYFQYLVDSIKTGDKKVIKELLNALHEVNEVGLGYSNGSIAGRGIGPIQAKDIREAFESSQAAKSGDIRDIADCALLIPGINRDKISDITANILKRQLVEFTKQQCDLHGIPTERVAINAFDHNEFKFKSYYDQLPVVDGKCKILLPITSVRRSPELSKDKYYRNFVLEFLKAEHSHAGDSLATVLKNGNVIVRIADLKAKYPMDTKFLYRFSKDHPHVLETYKSELRRTANKSGTKPVLETKKKILSADERVRILKDINVGANDATNFHNLSFDNLIHVFGSRLSNPQSEVKINEGRKRIDIVFNNNDKHGFFHKLNSLHHVHCPKIFVECKNYGRELGNPEIDQLQTRFSKVRGMFGILVCRSLEDHTKAIQRCRDVIHDRQAYVVLIDDNDIAILLRLKEEGNEIAIDDYMEAKLDLLIM